MSIRRQTVVKPQSVLPQSRAEAARPPKPTVERERLGAEERSPVSTRFDEIKKQWLDTISELKKVTWPDTETTKNLTLVVIGISIFLGVLLGGIDWIMQRLFALI
jgi:preprotein translocase subunit SecE